MAPSLRPAALPAVTRPCGRNGVLRVASASTVVPGRGCSSATASPQPSSELRAIVTSDSWITPCLYARCTRCWLSAAKASARSLVMWGSDHEGSLQSIP